ncbi:MAG: MoaD/ThiS family protein [Coriobacteriia bacterium]|nr:MoaD/ThiS family protein [Coriobacteriia bacterium]
MPETEVRFFGLLHGARAAEGRSARERVDIPEGGIVARDLAVRLNLPLDLIEGIFCDGKVHGPSHVVMPGDRVAFASKGVPGPHRFTLGLWQAGRESWE